MVGKPWKCVKRTCFSEHMPHQLGDGRKTVLGSIRDLRSGTILIHRNIPLSNNEYPRLAIELNLNQVPDRKATNERAERELLNRFRTWIICYLVDRLVCTNLGKPFMIPEDEVCLYPKFTVPGA